MLRALVSIGILLASLLALAKYAVVAPESTSGDAAAKAAGAPTAMLEDKDPPPPLMLAESSRPIRIDDASPSHAAQSSTIAGTIQQMSHTDVVFDDDDLVGPRVATRFRGRRSVPSVRPPARNYPGATTTPTAPPADLLPPSGPNGAASSNEPTPAKRPRANEPTPARRPANQLSSEPFKRNEPTPAQAVPAPVVNAPNSDSSLQLQVPAASPTPVLAQPQLELPQVAEPVELQSDLPGEESLGESGGLPTGVDPWYAAPKQWNATLANRRDNIRQCLNFYYARPLNSREHSPWSIMHTMIAWGTDAQILVGGERGERTSAVRWLCSNGVSDGVRLLTLNQGELTVKVGPGLQGHNAQFLALLAQSRVSRDYPIYVDGKTFTVNDLIEVEKKNCRAGTELTFHLIGLSHYLDTNASWKSREGQTWDFPRLIREEMAQPINGVTCGGTHRLMAMNYAVRRREYLGGIIEGDWARARAFTTKYQQTALSMQNKDGSFSTNFFRSRGDWGGIDRKLKTTGHTLEWLIFSLNHDQLQDPRIVRAVDMLTQMLMQNRYYEWEKGPIGHAIRALSLYDERVFGGRPGQRAEDLARQNGPRQVPRR